MAKRINNDLKVIKRSVSGVLQTDQAIKMVHESEMKKGWHLHITERFHNTGCDDVAWKMTEVDPMDIDPENTTVSLPVEMFQSILESDDEEIILPDIPLEAFGSEYFWKFFDYAYD